MSSTVTQRQGGAKEREDATEVRGLQAEVETHKSKEYTFWSAFSELFLESTRYGVHRLNGLLYLVLYFTACYLLASDYKTYQRTPLGWLIPLVGWLQALIASRTFTFLPTGIETDAQGYYSDKRTITYAFLLENIYFSGILLFQALYINTKLFDRLPLALECVFVFLPYALIRCWFPKTSLGASRNDDNQYTPENRSLLKAISLASKIFYVWAKHSNGFMLNYMIFLGFVKDSPEAMYRAQWLLLAGGWGTTPAMFLNTLKFKGMISAPLALGLYAGVFPVVVGLLVTFQVQYAHHMWLQLLVLAGVAVNFFPRHWKAQHIYQWLMMAYLLSVRCEMRVDASCNPRDWLVMRGPLSLK